MILMTQKHENPKTKCKFHPMIFSMQFFTNQIIVLLLKTSFKFWDTHNDASSRLLHCTQYSKHENLHWNSIALFSCWMIHDSGTFKDENLCKLQQYVHRYFWWTVKVQQYLISKFSAKAKILSITSRAELWLARICTLQCLKHKQLQWVDLVFLSFSIYHANFPSTFTWRKNQQLSKKINSVITKLTLRRYSVRNIKRSECFRTPRNCTILGWRNFCHNPSSFMNEFLLNNQSWRKQMLIVSRKVKNLTDLMEKYPHQYYFALPLKEVNPHWFLMLQNNTDHYLKHFNLQQYKFSLL